MSLKNGIYLLISVMMLLSCSVNKFIPEGGYLLDDVRIVSTTNAANAAKAFGYVRQKPNSKWFSLFKLPMYTYALSGLDSTKWVNRTLRRLGEKPVIFSSEQTERSVQNLQKMLVNDGYLHARVDFVPEINEDSNRLTAIYYLHEKELYYI